MRKSTELKEKIHFLKSQLDNKELSLYRVFLFVFSWNGIKRILNFIFRSAKFFIKLVLGIKVPEPYQFWMKENMPNKKDFKAYLREVDSFNHKPLISIVLPVYNPTLKYFSSTIQSVLDQIYTNWELCIVDDCSSKKDVVQYLNELAKKSERIKVKVRTENGNISQASNDALEMCTGEYVVLLDHDDLLTKDTLFHFVKLLQGDQTIDFMYADEDKYWQEQKEYLQPYFKPDWSPDSLESRNYILHPVCVKRTLINQVGGFSIGLEGAQDYDLFLKLSEVATNIIHIPKVLYHWRIHPESSAHESSPKQYAFDAQKRALEKAYERRGQEVIVEKDEKWPGVYHSRYVLKNQPKVSVIIPAKNQKEITELCLSTLFEKTTYPNFDVLVLSNNSDQPDFFNMLNTFKEKYPSQFNWVEQNYPFNYSKLVNEGFKLVDGELILHLNNDIEIINSDWMERMVEQAVRPEIGAVGAMLYYPNRLIQHVGVAIGLGGPAGHVFVGSPEGDGGPYFQMVANTNYAAVTGACLMIHRDKYKAVGGFEEDQVVEYNDIDFCLKILEAGYRNLYLSKVKLVHHESLSRGHPHKTKKSYEQHIKDVGRFRRIWGSYIDYDPYYNPNLTRTYVDFRPRE